MAFSNRWRIEGTLLTRSPLYLGGGEPVEREELCEKTDNSKHAQIAGLPSDCRGRAYIPGSAIKGNLRSWLNTCISNTTKQTEGVIAAVFGSENPAEKGAVGGKAEFWDAFALEQVTPLNPPPYWCQERLTGVTASVAIDRQRRTAVEKKLFYHEFVPEGVSFRLRITAQNLNPEEVDLLLMALDGFGDSEYPCTIGASVGDGYGRFGWRLDSIAYLEKGADVVAWLRCPGAGAGYAVGLNTLSVTERDDMVRRARERYGVIPPACLTLGLTIRFDSPFLVNDPSRCKKEQRSSDEAPEAKLPDCSPRRDQDGLAYLPAQSLRGAVRSQAERIIRTLNLKPGAVCYSTDPVHSCRAVHDMVEVENNLCLACRVLGAPGWRSPVEFSDFRQVAGVQEEFRQEMVAIDRFTGGVAGSAKFNTGAVLRPVLRGTIAIDLERMPAWGLGLMALVIRDLIEGDIPTGFGARKGYGMYQAKIESVHVTTGKTISSELQAILKQNGLSLESLDNVGVATLPPEEVQLTIMDLLKAFHQKVATSGQKTPPGGRNG